MKRRCHERPADRGRTRKLLHNLYAVYADWIRPFPLACREGCGACCTRSVTMTSLEGEIILDFIRERAGMDWLLQKLATAAPGKNIPRLTTNRFAEACLKQQAVDEDTRDGWDFGPCVFLEDERCTIYEARPFGCRSFVSLQRCDFEGSAEMAPIHLTVNTVFTQIIEHLSSVSGGCWAGLTDVLQDLAGCGPVPQTKKLAKARPVPGFLLEPQELRVITGLWREIRDQSGVPDSPADLIDNLLLIE